MSRIPIRPQDSELEEGIVRNIIELVVEILNEDARLRRLLLMNVRLYITVMIPLDHSRRFRIICDMDGCRIEDPFKD